MQKFSVSHSAAAGTNLTMINITGGTTILALYDLIIGSQSTPANVATLYALLRSTDAGVGGTALTEVKVDPKGGAAAGAAVGGAFTTEPTYTDKLLHIALNQQATFRWVAVPGGELLSTAAAGNGIGLRSIASGGTPQTDTTIFWEE